MIQKKQGFGEGAECALSKLKGLVFMGLVIYIIIIIFIFIF
jgi:hypothetical protein